MNPLLFLVMFAISAVCLCLAIWEGSATGMTGWAMSMWWLFSYFMASRVLFHMRERAEDVYDQVLKDLADGVSD